MKAWVITYKGRPATLDAIKELERVWHDDSTQVEDSLLCAPTRDKAIALYLYHVGFTWAERAKGVSVARLTTTKEG